VWLGDELLNANGRSQILSSSMDVFRQLTHSPCQWLFGVGTSSWLVVMPIVQGTQKAFFIWLHNEPVQIFWEQGIIGISLIIFLFGYIVKRNFRNAPMIIVILATGLQSFIQPCLRYFLFALFIGFLTRLSLEPDLCEEVLCQIH
jgi:O-antigen ligase